MPGCWNVLSSASNTSDLTGTVENCQPVLLAGLKTKSREALASRPVIPVKVLESPAQRELNQSRIPVRPHNLSERTARRIRQILFNIRHRGIGKVRVVPEIEEVGREAHILALANTDMLQQREIPVLLEWPVIQISPQISESDDARVPARIVLSLALARRSVRIIEVGNWLERCRVEISIRHSLLHAPVRKPGTDRGSRCETCTQQRRTAGTEKCRPGARIVDRERQSRLEDRYPADLPSAKRRMF
jgi:hypothetical protein